MKSTAIVLGLQIAGAIAIAIGVGLLNLAAGLIVAGVLALAFGVAADR